MPGDLSVPSFFKVMLSLEFAPASASRWNLVTNSRRVIISRCAFNCLCRLLGSTTPWSLLFIVFGAFGGGVVGVVVCFLRR